MKRFSFIIVCGLIIPSLFIISCNKNDSEELQPIPIDEILFEDEFNNDLSLWEIICGDWSIDEGKLSGIGWGGNIDAWIYAGSYDWTDYEISFMAYFQPRDEGISCAEICLRSTEHWENEYRIEVFPKEWGQVGDTYNNRIVICKYTDGDEKIMFDGYCPFEITNPSEIKASIIGQEIKLYINKQFVMNYIDNFPIQEGRIGLGSIWSLHTKYDDVLVLKK